mmetsp:Transcript_6422/g.19434  ORF Transcript_6422/g.19434 Transcript_6422/m.19434 type:complete len:1045 (+) Transcript_6422:1-3135(+)
MAESVFEFNDAMVKPALRLVVSRYSDRVEIRDDDTGRMLVFPVRGDGTKYHPPTFLPAGPATSAGAIETLGAYALLGVIQFFTSPVILLAVDVPEAAQTPLGNIYTVQKVQMLRLSHLDPSEKDKALAGIMMSILESGSVFFSYDFDATKSCQKYDDLEEHFWWSKPWSRLLGDKGMSMAVRCAFGYAGSSPVRTTEGKEAIMTVISRRSRKRAGTRYLTRGADFKGDVANFVETEQIIWDSAQPQRYCAFRIIRGSIPVFWRQSNGIAKPEPELDGSTFSSRVAFTSHFKRLSSQFGSITAISLVNQHGSEKILADAFEDHMLMDADKCDPKPRLVAFDFHARTTGSRYEEGLKNLLELIKEDVRQQGVYFPCNNLLQTGAFRVNCVDCLDRTGVVQAMISKTMLSLQLYFVLGAETRVMTLSPESELVFKKIWADNADAISKQYSGTGALKTDYTRTGKRSTRGMLEDGVKSVMRIYYKNFVDGGRQDAIDTLCGYGLAQNLAIISNGRVGILTDVMRVTPGGERTPVTVELLEDSMLVANLNSILNIYPRRGLVSWERQDEHSSGPCLRLIYRTVEETSPASFPLTLQFSSKEAPLRERFLRSLISWSQPGTAEHFGKKYSLAVVAVDNLEGGFHWVPAEVDILFVVLARENNRDRCLIPQSYETNDLVLIQTTPDALLFVKRRVVPVVSYVRWTRNVGGLVLAAQISAVDICLVFTVLAKPPDLSDSLRFLKIGRSGYDVSRQFDHLYICGLVPSATWPSSEWSKLGNGYSSKTFNGGLFALKASLFEIEEQENSVFSSENVGSTTVLVSDDINGREAPRIPTGSIYSGTIQIIDVCADGIKHPPGIDTNLPLRNYVRFESNLISGAVRSRTLDRPTSSPSWLGETLESEVVASSEDEMKSTALYGQVVLALPIVGDVVAGYFALAGHRSGKFELPLLLGSKNVGRIQGTVVANLHEASSSDAGLPMEAPLTAPKKSGGSKKVQNLFGKVTNYLSGASASDPFARSSSKSTYMQDESGLEARTQKLSVEDEVEDDKLIDL